MRSQLGDTEYNCCGLFQCKCTKTLTQDNSFPIWNYFSRTSFCLPYYHVVDLHFVLLFAGVQGGRNGFLLTACGRESGTPDSSSNSVQWLHSRGYWWNSVQDAVTPWHTQDNGQNSAVIIPQQEGICSEDLHSDTERQIFTAVTVVMCMSCKTRTNQRH